MCNRVAHADLNTVVTNMRLMTAHVPHSGYAQIDIDARLEAVVEIVVEGRRGERLCVCGLGATASFGCPMTGVAMRSVADMALEFGAIGTMIFDVV